MADLSEREPGERSPTVAVTAAPGASGGLALAAAFGVAAARGEADPAGPPAPVVLCDVAATGRRRPTLVSSGAARRLEERLRGDVPAAARGALCWSALPAGAPWRDQVERCRAVGASLVVVQAEPVLWRQLVDDPQAGVRAVLLRANRDDHRSLAGLLAIESRGRRLPSGIVTYAPGLVATRRALAGIEPGGALSARARRLVARLLGQRGQALPLVLALAALTVVAGLLLAMLGAAASGGARLQRAADLAAVSAARSMRDDHHRLFLPARTASGVPNPGHLDESAYRARAVAAARRALRANAPGSPALRVSFPGEGFAPTRVRVDVGGAVTLDGARRSRGDVVASAVAEAYPMAPHGSGSSMATGGGYSGPLAYRQGKPMRPDVAAAFDRLNAAASRDGHALIVTSAFRSDAEQAELFAANPDPRWVAPPGKSLHRCATELDLGPTSAYGWLAANAPRFGFLRRYSWEAWHFGYVRGPAPCSAEGDRLGGVANGDGRAAASVLSAFVPARFRAAITRAADRWNVPAGLLAAQLLAESGFNPFAVSAAGARGIAQFMPGTAAAYGLRDPFDPVRSIAAQAHLMSDLLSRFGSVPLALAAYNAGPTPVAACGCVPPYPETQAYVSRILGLLGGAGEIAPPALEVRLVE